MSILKKFEEKRRNLTYEFGRKKFINNIIANIGEIVEDEYSISCIVKQDLLDKNSKPNFYQLRLFGMNNQYEKLKEIIDYYKLDKPVHYIFDGITFDVPITIFSHFCDITFVNCTFSHSYFNIFHVDKITFAGNRYYDGTSTISGGAFLRTISSSKIGELNFKNEHFINQYELKKYGENNFGIDINADKVNIINSTIITDERNGQINMKAKDIKILKSMVNSPEIYLDASLVDVDRKSKLKSEKGIIIGNEDLTCDVDICMDDLFSPYIVFNGVEMVNCKTGNTAFYHDDPVKIQEKRIEVSRVFREIKHKCDEFTEEKGQSVKNGIESQSIKELLKK